jgi:hypothetical protein
MLRSSSSNTAWQARTEEDATRAARRGSHTRSSLTTDVHASDRIFIVAQTVARAAGLGDGDGCVAYT